MELAEGKREWTHPNTRKKSNDRLYDGTIFHRVIPDFMVQEDQSVLYVNLLLYGKTALYRGDCACISRLTRSTSRNTRSVFPPKIWWISSAL